MYSPEWLDHVLTWILVWWDLVNRTFEFYKTVIAMTYSEFMTSEKRTELGLIFVNEVVMKVGKVVAWLK